MLSNHRSPVQSPNTPSHPSFSHHDGSYHHQPASHIGVNGVKPPGTDRKSTFFDPVSESSVRRPSLTGGPNPAMGSPPATATSSAYASPQTTYTADRPPTTTVQRVNDPMSFSNILSSSEPSIPEPSPSSRLTRKPSRTSIHTQPTTERDVPPPPPSALPTSSQKRKYSDLSADVAMTNGAQRPHSPNNTYSHPGQATHSRSISLDTKLKQEADGGDVPVSRPGKAKIVISEKDFQTALAMIEAREKGHVETSTHAAGRLQYLQAGIKRTIAIEKNEMANRKRRRIGAISAFAHHFSRQAEFAVENYYQTNQDAMCERLQEEEAAEEKERKKNAQRDRRRETNKRKAEMQAAELKQQAAETSDQDERERLLSAAQRAEKRVSNANRLLSGEAPIKDTREITPLAPNLEGGIMTSFHMDEDQVVENPKRKPRAVRAKKSKEQKKVEKENAELGQAALDRGEELVTIAPKSEFGRSKRQSAADRDTHFADSGPAAAKAYDQLYESIWKDIARKDIVKLYKLKDNSTTVKLANARKTCILASKEARRWQMKTNKSTKDLQARAKRIMKEMISYWKRNERDERDQRKMAEKQELENAKRAEAEREANRQKRKLNFLISQTELYSHFIGKKIKTDAAERSSDDVAETIVPANSSAHSISLPASTTKAPARVTNFEELDFDNDDETVLKEAAMANAQLAVQEAQDRARSFNTDAQLQSQFDDGEMNFQNPTSLQSMDIPQPKMLTCQLKEYQLKGLNWLVNLYEQGINGILADEMGLGKTVQSISVMSHLAETYNIWGPFLVIAPASTLHNWQQEIVRFAPKLKVLPYWGNAKDRKILRKFWDRKHITYNKDSEFHVLVTSYQLVVHDTQYFQKIRWQYMILDEAQAIKSSQSSRWKSLLGFHCRNRLLLTGTPIQNNMQELWALLHFIMPSLFDSHDEFSDWFSKDIESHAQSNTKLNEDQLKRLHMILKPFMLRRVKRNVQKELGDKIEEDVFCSLTYRQRAYYTTLRNKISLLDLIEKATIGDDHDTATLMNLVMQFRKVCNHPDLFERAETMSPVSFAYFAETASFLREGQYVDVGYSVRNLIDYRLPRLIGRNSGRIYIPGPDNEKAGSKHQLLYSTLSVWSADHIVRSARSNGVFSWLRFVDSDPGQISQLARKDVFQRAVDANTKLEPRALVGFDDEDRPGASQPPQALFNIAANTPSKSLASSFKSGIMYDLHNVSSDVFYGQEIHSIDACIRPAASAPPVELYASSQGVIYEKQRTFFNVPIRRALQPMPENVEVALLRSPIPSSVWPKSNLLPQPISSKQRYTRIQVPSMRRFVTDSGKLARLDRLLAQLKDGGHRVLLYFQMTRMIDLMEEYLTYRNYKYCRLDGSTKLEDRRDTVADFQSRSDIFIFLLSTRAGGLGINLTAADTVIFYDSDWNPTIDSQAMDRAHRLGQTKQVTVYRLITRGTIEERIRKRALQKEEVQRVVISGGASQGVDFNAGRAASSRENKAKDIAMWLADDEQAEAIERREQEYAEAEANAPPGARKKKITSKKAKEVSLEDMYHEGEGHFDDSNKPSGATTPVDAAAIGKKRKGISKKAKTVKQKLAIIDGEA